jgi:hypothetical protein
MSISPWPTWENGVLAAVLLGFVYKLVSLLKIGRDEQRAQPCLSVACEWVVGCPQPVRTLFLVFRTDVTVDGLEGAYSLNTPLSLYRKPKTKFLPEVLYSGKDRKIAVTTLALDTTEVIKKAELDMVIPVEYEYELKTGERYKKTCEVRLKRGSTEFRTEYAK